MIKITDILSKEVLSLADAAAIGIISNAFFSEDLSRLKGWTVVQDDSDDEGLLPLARIIGEKDAVTVMNGAAVKMPVGIKCPLGMRTFDSEGRILGILRDILVDENTGLTAALLVDETSYDPASVLRASRYGVILRSPVHTLLRVRHAPSGKPRPRRTAIEPTESTPHRDAPTESPATAYGEYAFLIGRTVSKDLIANGETLAKEGAQVDATIIETARSKGKLVELTVNSKKA